MWGTMISCTLTEQDMTSRHLLSHSAGVEMLNFCFSEPTLRSSSKIHVCDISSNIKTRSELSYLQLFNCDCISRPSQSHVRVTGVSR